mmetsp:Transcript_19999/g.24232  ORF Transcript_19999/g.24232 Transcript_19999/m.24232 type:complete len:322 (-) Transcript_19999:236-1201(-)
MASRDLTRKFAEMRQARPGRGRSIGQQGREREQQPFRSGGYSSDTSDIEANTSAAATAPALPPIWVDLVDSVESDIGKIEKAMRDLQAVHTKRLMVSFDDANEAAMDQEIEGKTREATRLFRSCESSLKRIALTGNDLSDSERTIRANIQRGMALRIQRLNQDFRRSQGEYLSRLKRQKEGANDATFDFLSGGQAAVDYAVQDDSGGFNEQQIQAVADIEALVVERDEEIRKIAESIQELSTIFKELAVLVIDQGTILDRIDFNMEQVAEHTRKGVIEIEKAEQYQKAARPRICIALLLFLNALMLIFLVLKHSESSKKKK